MWLRSTKNSKNYQTHPPKTINHEDSHVYYSTDKCTVIATWEGCKLAPGCSWCHPGMCQPNTVVCQKDSDIFWNSPGGGSWTESSNWDLGRIPADSDTVYVSLSGRYDVAVDIAVNVKNLILGGVCRSGFCSSKPRLLVHQDLTTEGLLINQGAELYVYYTRILIVDGQALNNGILRLGGPTCQFNQGVENYGAIIIQDSGATLTGNITNHGFFDFNPAYGGLNINNVLHNKASGTIALGSTSSRIYRGHVLNEGAITMDCGCSEEVQCSCNHYIGCSLVNFGMISIRSGTADFYEDVQLSGTLELALQTWMVFRSTSTILESATTVHSETGSVEFYDGSHNLESADVHIGKLACQQHCSFECECNQRVWRSQAVSRHYSCTSCWSGHRCLVFEPAVV